MKTKNCKVKYTFQDDSSVEVEIDPNLMPIIIDVIHRIQSLQNYDTCVTQSEMSIYDGIKPNYAKAWKMIEERNKND